MISSGSTVGIAGAGTMGAGIAQVALEAGHPVVLYDADPDALKRSRDVLDQALNKRVEKRKLSEAEAGRLRGRITRTGELRGLAGSSLFIEAIAENLDAKKNLLGSLSDVLGGECILATNTSSLSVTAVASGFKDPGRVLGLHFFNPAPLMPLVEIVPGLETKSSLPAEARELMERWGKTPVIARDLPGFIVNRIARPFYGEALRLVEEGLAGTTAVDQAMKEVGGFKMGPFELMDLIGLDVNYAVTVSVWEQFYYDPRYKPSVMQKRMCESGRLGRKTGRGFYDYQGRQAPPPSESSVSGQAIFFRILAMLINEAADALYYNIAGKQDIETAMTRGVNYPKGLLSWADETGVGLVYRELYRLRNEYDEERYRPSVLLKRMAEKNERFFP